MTQSGPATVTVVISKFRDINPDTDLARIDFNDPTSRQSLDWGALSAADQQTVQAYARLLRLCDEPALVEKLIEAGLLSAHHIAREPEAVFVAQYRDRLGLEEDGLRTLHRRAVDVKSRVQLLSLGLRETVGSAHYRTSAMNTLTAASLDYVGGLPSYQDFFGSLDYCSCDPDQSVFSPSAYLVDILRIVYQHIDNSVVNPGIPSGWHLSDRRPDIGNIPLTPEMARQLVPVIQIVNEVLEARIANETGWSDVFRSLGDTIYPQTLPFNLPLEQTRANLDKLGSSLLLVYRAMKATKESPASFSLPGDAAIGQEALLCSPTQAALVTTELRDATAIGNQFGLGDGRILSFAASGTLSCQANGYGVTGSGTAFVTEIRAGDQIQIKSQRRTVTGIASATSLSVDQPWKTAGSDNRALVVPAQDLGLSMAFAERTGLDFGGVTHLLRQTLSDEEVAAGLLGRLFINKDAAAGTYLDIALDESDPDWPVSRIKNLTGAGLDRLNRLIRLARISGIDVADLDWLIQSLGKTLNAATLTELGRTRMLATTLEAPLDVTVALFHTIKTYGSGTSSRPVDLFNRLFNSPAVLGTPAGVKPAYTARGTVAVGTNLVSVTGTGTAFRTQGIAVGMRININGDVRVVGAVTSETALTVTAAFSAAGTGLFMMVLPTAETPSSALPLYRPAYAENPLFSDAVFQWNPDGGGSMRGRLRAGLGVGDADLTLIGSYFLATLKKANAAQTTIPLTVPNLSALFAFAKLAQLNRVPVANFLKLLSLLGIDQISNLDTAIEATDWAGWMRESHLDPFMLDYVVNDVPSKLYDPIPLVARLPDAIAAIWFSSTDWRLNARSFVDKITDETRSDSFFRQLTDPKNAFVSPAGIVLDKAITFAALAFLEPLTSTAFVAPSITLQESAGAFNALVAGNILSAAGILQATFTPQGALPVLFAGDQQQAAKTALVRMVLVDTRSRILHVADILGNYGGAPTRSAPNKGIQQFQLCDQLSNLLGTSTELLLTLAPLIADVGGLGNYVAAIVTPPTGSAGAWALPSDTLKTFFTQLQRMTLLTSGLALGAADVALISTTPKPFGFDGLAKLTVSGVRMIWEYKRLQRQFNDDARRLDSVLSTAPGNTCISDPRTATLSLLTGWPVQDICQYATALFNNGPEFSTIAGLVRLDACFTLSTALAVHATGLLTLAALGTLPAQITNAAWTAYSSAATTTGGSLTARFGGPDWDTVYRPVLNRVNSAKRAALQPYAIYRLNQKWPSIKNTDTLYSYLLIDTEMGTCSDISYIKQAMLSVQLYMQRAHMMLEPGISKTTIPEVWWTWLLSYRLWEANRRIFLYPENYLEPELRRDMTPLFKKSRDDLTANNITAETVNDAYVSYFEEFTKLAALKPVSAFFGKAPDPAAMGALSPTLFLISRTNTEPYTYYVQRKVNDNRWSAFEQIDVSIPAPIVSPVYAFNRLFLFWVSQDTTSPSEVKSGTAVSSLDTRATVQYSFINFSGKWASPQTLGKPVINYKPMADNYKTALIDPATFNTEHIQWRTVSPVLIKGKVPTEERILINYGGFYDLPNKAAAEPAQPSPDRIPNPDAFALATTIYNSTVVGNAVPGQGIVGAAFINTGWFIDGGLNASPTNTIAFKYDMTTGAPQPYFPITPRRVLPPGSVKALRIFKAENIFLMDYLGQGAPYSLVAPDTPITLLSNVSDRAGYACPVVNQPFRFLFSNGDESFLISSTETGVKTVDEIVVPRVGSLTNQTNLVSKYYTDKPQAFNSIIWSLERLSTGAMTRLNQALFAGGVSALLAPASQVTPATPLLPFSRFFANSQPSPNIRQPALPSGDAIDYDGPYGLYFWEVFLHTPWLIANRLRTNRSFPEAKAWLEYIFNPAIPAGSDSTVTDQKDRFWRLVAFRGLTVESLKESLSNAAQLQAYNNYPFDPHAIANLRKSAYQKAIVIRYVKLLIEWADFEFTKDTWESLTTATLLYILARDLLGPKPVDVGPCKTSKPLTFKAIYAKYGNDIPQFLLDMEGALPASSVSAAAPSANRYVPFNDLDSYFCVSENSELVGLWDTVEAQLYKIRNCMNIQGVVRKLALFEPPIDPHALVRAAAGGGVQVVNQLQAGAPPYRFRVVLSLAKGLAAQLSQLGGQLLATLEKKDGEDLARVRAQQESQILTLTTRTIQLQIAEIQETLTGLSISREAAVGRETYYRDLVSTGLLASERLAFAMTILSNVLSTTSSVMRVAASVAHLVPNVGSPFAMTYGGEEIGSSIDSAASVFDVTAGIARAVGDISQTVAGYERRQQDWEQQFSQASHEVKQLDSQISGTKIQQQNVEQQLAVHKQSLQNAADVDSFLKKKFTNTELYQWMEGQLGSLYGQAYRLALELAVSAQQAYQFELNSNEQLINFDYWNQSRKGLLSGEQLTLSLSQMESYYFRKHVRGMEIEKTISLLALDPRALLELKKTGSCSFSFSEYLFDLDYPGHYGRQIYSIRVTIPAVVGPNQNIKATLVQLSSQVVLTPSLDAVKFLLGVGGNVAPDTGVLRANWRPNQKVALSSGVEDGGVFELSAADERYLPFENTGAVSTWRLEMSKEDNLFDFDTLTDVVFRVRYTASDGGSPFASEVRNEIRRIPYQGQRAFNLAVEFPGPWFSFLNPAAAATQQSFSVPLKRSYFPPNLDLTQVVAIHAQIALADGVTLGGGLSATLTVGPAATASKTPVVFDATTGFAEVANLALSNWVDQPWTLTITKDGIPAGVRDSATQLLKATAVRSIGLLITYGANRARPV